MNSYERRIIHITLQSNEKVETESIGEGPLKEIVVKYKRKEKDGNVEVSEEITYGPSSDFSKMEQKVLEVLEIKEEDFNIETFKRGFRK